jgi:membrane-associated phospholipid phosphatase
MKSANLVRRLARASALVAVLVLPLHAAGTAEASDPPRVEWNPKWRKVGLEEGLALIPLGGALLAISLAWTPPQEAHWKGGIFFDSRIRSAFRGESAGTQRAANDLGNMLFVVGSVLPIVVDVGVTLAVHQKPDIALQILLIDLQSVVSTALLSLTVQFSVGRGRPFFSECQPDGTVRDEAGRVLPNRCDTGDEARSFYSGHAAATMASAGFTCLTHQRMPLFGGGVADVAPCALMLGVTLTTGVTRIIADKHWASDVVIGWGIGALTGYVLPAAIHYGFSNDSNPGASLRILPVASASTQHVQFGVLGAF